jgi:hypothetical protein
MKWKYPGLPKFVPVASTPLTVMFLPGIITHGKKQAMTKLMAAMMPIHFIQRIRTGLIGLQDKAIKKQRS